MLAKIISAGSLTLLLTGGALAYIPQPHNIYAGHSNSQQGAKSVSSLRLTPRRMDSMIRRARTPWAVARVKWGGTLEVFTQGFEASELRSPFCPRRVTELRAPCRGSVPANAARQMPLDQLAQVGSVTNSMTLGM
jgi:hypothetical protein